MALLCCNCKGLSPVGLHHLSLGDYGSPAKFKALGAPISIIRWREVQGGEGSRQVWDPRSQEKINRRHTLMEFKSRICYVERAAPEENSQHILTHRKGKIVPPTYSLAVHMNKTVSETIQYLQALMPAAAMPGAVMKETEELVRMHTQITKHTQRARVHCI